MSAHSLLTPLLLTHLCLRESLCFPVTWVHLSIATGTKKMHRGEQYRRSYLFRMRLYHVTHCFVHCLCCEVSAVRGPDRRAHENEASVNVYDRCCPSRSRARDCVTMLKHHRVCESAWYVSTITLCYLRVRMSLCESAFLSHSDRKEFMCE